MSTSIPHLTQALATVQRVAPQVCELPHAVQSISDFLDVSMCTALPAAAARGSLTLVERIAQRLTNDQHLSPAMLKHWFGRAMQVAIENNNLAMVQKIHSHHPEPLVLYSLQLALKHGTLEMVQWIVEHRHDRLCCAPGIQNICSRCLYQSMVQLGCGDALRIVNWLYDEGVALSRLTDGTAASPLVRAGLDNVTVLRWLNERDLVSQEAAETLLIAAISSKFVDGVATVEYLVARGFNVADESLVDALIRGSCHTQNESTVEAAIVSHLCDSIREHFVYTAVEVGGPRVLQWSREYIERPENQSIPVRTRYCAIHNGHVATLQWLHQQRYALPDVTNLPFLEAEQDVLRFCDAVEDLGLGRWNDRTVDLAAGFGHLKTVQRLLTGTAAHCTALSMDLAAGHGHLHVVKWLHANRTEGCTSLAMERAAANGHLEVVQWLCDNRSEHNTTKAMACAAIHGQLDVLVWLHETQPDGCPSCATIALLNGADENGPNKGALNALQWLRERSAPTTCGKECFGTLRRSSWLGQLAAYQGDLQLLQCLLVECTEDGFATIPGQMTSVAGALGAGGHLPLMQWVHARFGTAVDWNQVRRVAMLEPYNRSDIVAWLDHQ